ncbi:MAG: Asp-tRNA(Asn)/Glu-tRNA(Gln) amidotransferase subunit GatC [Candidatus Saccharibacteria bacterium]
MTTLTREDVLKLARLSRLSLTDEEVDEYLEELTQVLQYVEQLQGVNVDGLNPTTQVTGLANVMREDTVKDYGVSRDDLLALAPQTQDGQLKVKRMIG